MAEVQILENSFDYHNTISKLEVSSLESILPHFKSVVTEYEFNLLISNLQGSSSKATVTVSDPAIGEFQFNEKQLHAAHLSILTQSAIGNLIRMREDESTFTNIPMQVHKNKIFRFMDNINLLKPAFPGLDKYEADWLFTDLNSRLVRVTASHRNSSYKDTADYGEYLEILKSLYDDLNFVGNGLITMIAKNKAGSEYIQIATESLWKLVDSYHNRANPVPLYT